MKIKDKRLKILYILELIIIISAFYLYNHNLIFVSSEEKQKIADALKIENCDTFHPINVKFLWTGPGNDFAIRQLNFKISISDYQKNHLSYDDIDTAEASHSYKIRKGNKYYCEVRRVIGDDENFDKNIRGINTSKVNRFLFWLVIALGIINFLIIKYLKKKQNPVAKAKKEKSREEIKSYIFKK